MSVAEEKEDFEAEADAIKEAPDYTPEEQEALDSGWNPEGKDKDGKTLDAKEYMARKPLFNKIHNLRTEQETMNSQMGELRSDMKKMTQVFMQEKQALLDQLKEQRTEALDNLETDTVKKLDKQIESVSAATQDVASYDQKEWSKSFISFVKENNWYDKNPGLKSVADIIGKEYVEANQGASPQEVYNYVADRIKKEFSDRFDEKSDGQKKNSKVSTSSRRSTESRKKQGVSLSDLDSESQKVVQVMATATGKTVEEYLKTYEL